jgi:O-antigen/teichoic acid export membrane protein
MPPGRAFKESILASQIALLAGQGAGLALGWVATVILAQRMYAAAFARVVVAYSILAITAAIVDAGLTAALTADLARSPDAGGAGGARSFRRVIVRRWLLAIGCALILVPAALWIGMRGEHWPDGPFAPVGALMAAVLLLPLRTHQARLAAAGRNRWIAAIGFTTQAAFVAILATNRPWGVMGVDDVITLLAAREAAVSLLSWACAALADRPRGNAGGRAVPVVRPLESGSGAPLWPLALATAFSVLAYHADVFLVRNLLSETSAGRFGVAARLVQPMVAAVGLLAAPILPRLARARDRAASARIAFLGSTLLAGAVLPAAAVIARSDAVLDLATHERGQGAAAAFAVLVATLLPIAFGTMASLALIAQRRYRTWCAITALGLALKLALGVFLIPRVHMAGAAWAALAAEIAIAGLAGAAIAAPRAIPAPGLLLRAGVPAALALAASVLIRWSPRFELPAAIAAAALAAGFFVFGPWGKKIRLAIERAAADGDARARE